MIPHTEDKSDRESSSRSLMFNFTADTDGERIDNFLVRMLEDIPDLAISRSKIQKLIKDCGALVDNRPCKKNHILTAGEKIELAIPSDESSDIMPETFDFDILMEDEDIIIVNKPAGIITHPTETIPTGTLINGLIGKGIQLASAGGIHRPGVVHRLDKETSGVLVLAKTDRAFHALTGIFKDRLIEKYYLAIVIGNMRDLKGSFDLRIGRHPKNRVKMAAMKTGGKDARTDYKVVERFTGFDLVRCQIFTGRTHQIRVHLAHSGRSVLNDTVYGTKELTEHIRWLGQRGIPADQIGKLMTNLKLIISQYSGMLLHAERIKLLHPVNQKEIDVTAPLPVEFLNILETLRTHTTENEG
ncbi:MAG: RluA family pseudouridine synthase [bacterium]